MAVAIACMMQAGQPPADDPLKDADKRIDRYRKGNVTLQVLDSAGNPVRNAEVKVRQTRHAFLFGCNIFPLFSYPAEQEKLYEQRFSDLLNYATLPFYWGAYEREQGKTDAARIRRMAEWCRDHGIATKGHPLVWHEVWPGWAPNTAAEAKPLLERRVRRIVNDFAGLIDRWDVVNEATVSARTETGVGDWAKSEGASAMVATALRWARDANSKATLLYNDFNVGPAFEKLVEDLQKAKAPLDAIGIQSHMHAGEWPLSRVWQVCETYSRFNLPIHFTELTVLSGAHKTDSDWHAYRTDWHTTPEGEKRQSEYVVALYTLLFSHPSVQAITWWDLMDGGWQGAPAGLVRKDLSPKPAYEALRQLIREKWWTKLTLRTDTQGRVRFRGFGGEYSVEHGGRTAEFAVEPRVDNRPVVRLK